MIASQTNGFKPIQHSYYPRANVEKYDFHQGNHFFFGDEAISTKTLAKTTSREKLVVVVLNHKDKIYFVGRTTSPAQYIYNYGRFFATRDGAGVSTQVRDRYTAANQNYWSVEFLKARPATEALVNSKLKDWRHLSGYVHTEQPGTRNLIRATHIATGWTGFFTMLDRAYIGDSTKRWNSLRDVTSRVYQTSLSYNRDLSAADLKHEHKLLVAMIARDAQSCIGFSFKIIESATDISEQNRLVNNAQALVSIYYHAWSASENIAKLAKHFRINKESTSIGVYPSNLPAPLSCQFPDPNEFKNRTEQELLKNLTGLKQDRLKPEPVAIEPTAPKTPEVVSGTITTECGLGVNAFCTAIAEVISSSTVLTNACGLVTTSQIESTILAGTLPEVGKSFAYIEAVVIAAKAIHRANIKETTK